MRDNNYNKTDITFHAGLKEPESIGDKEQNLVSDDNLKTDMAPKPSAEGDTSVVTKWAIAVDRSSAAPKEAPKEAVERNRSGAAVGLRLTSGLRTGQFDMDIKLLRTCSEPDLTILDRQGLGSSQDHRSCSNDDIRDAGDVESFKDESVS